MARTVYVWRDGLGVIPREEAPPLHVRHGAGPQVISDVMDPIRSMADGRFYDSKSQYRRDLRARGFYEVGNDRVEFTPMPLSREQRRADIRRTINELRGR